MRVLVVDDSNVARQLIVGILKSDSDIEVVGEARDGVEAIQLASKLRPDLITMDVNMPRKDGFEATLEIMTDWPTPILIVSSSQVVSEVSTAMKAMQAGALWVVLKPSGPAQANFEKRSREFLAMVKAMAEVKVVRHRRRTQGKSSNVEPAAQQPVPRPKTLTRVVSGAKVVAIGISTGGPTALQTLLKRIPRDFPLPILIVQHISKGFMTGLVKWLNDDPQIALPVKVAVTDEPLQPGTVYFGPEGQHFGVGRRDKVLLSNAPDIDSFRPSATFLFQSVAKEYGEGAIGVIMTGMGTDGLQGLNAIHAAGGRIIAQDCATCVVYGMPRAAVEAGIVDAVLPLNSIAEHLLRLVGYDLKLRP